MKIPASPPKEATKIFRRDFGVFILRVESLSSISEMGDLFKSSGTRA